MKHLLNLTLLFWITLTTAQFKMELTPQGFPSMEIKTPNKTLDKLMEASKAWAPYYNKKGADVFNVTEKSLTIEARNESAYYYYNVGVKYYCDIVYSLKITFQDDKTYTLLFAVKEIYAENVLKKTTVTDFFSPEGKLKDDFTDAKPSLEKTASNIVNSFINFIER
ncbi:hypothetical protein [Flavobacterium sp. 25HG05S-40]|uniref:hypothetical protein n=1 Tax=Flavobacterium sp. 25HG05S-40 TaxID=3458682 RepID=UPI0040448BD7